MWKAICVATLIFVIQGGLCLARKTGCPVPEDINPCECSNNSIFGITLKCESFSSVEDVKNAFVNSEGYKFNLVTIRDAKLQYLPHYLFENVKVKELRLEYLRLDQVFDRQPKALEELKVLVVKGNLVSRGSFWEILQPLKSLRTLFIEDIRMIKIGKDFSHYATKDLQSVYFTRTNTETIQPGAFDKFKNIRLLHISNCSIATLTRDMFPTPFNVRNLAFDHQKLTKIQEGLFSHMPNLKILTMVDNQIATVPENAFDTNFRVEVLMLDDNPIKCDCRFKWLLDKRVTLSGTCASPKWLQGKRLDHLSKGYFHC